MNDPQEAEIDGWKIRIWKPFGARRKYHAEARDPLWAKFAEAFGETTTDALKALSDKTGIDFDELTRSFGV